MKKTIRMALMLATALLVQPALAGHAARQSTEADNGYVAKMPDSDAGRYQSNLYIAAPSCSGDSSPADPVYFKLADGRCSGQ